MLLLAGLGIGAFMLFKNKGNAERSAGEGPSTTSESETEIPAAPSIVAVNTSSTESPLPTGIVSDEEGMEAVNTSNVSPQPQSRVAPTGDEEASGETSSQSIPPLVSTRLTPKEQTIINQGVLTDDLAIQRPDLYRAIYIRKHGSNGNGRQALQAANTAIQQIRNKRGAGNTTLAQMKRRKMAIRLHPNAGSMVTAAINQGKRGASGSQPQSPTGQPTVLPNRTTVQKNRKVRKGAHPVQKPVRNPLPRRKPVTRKKH